MALAWDAAPSWGKRQKRGEIGKISASDTSRAVVWGGETLHHPFSTQTTAQLASLAHFFPRTPISPFSNNAEPGPRLMWPQTRERAVDGSIFGLCLLNWIKEFIVINVL